jgi:AraC-like DNA-binding protein
MLCPVCSKEFVKKSEVSRHLFKMKSDKAHLNFVRKQSELINKAFYEEITSKQLSEHNDCYVSNAYINTRWKKLPGFEERKLRMKSLGNKRKTKIKEGTHEYNDIISLFSSDLTIKQIAYDFKSESCIIRGIFVRKFGKLTVRERSLRVRRSNCLDNKMDLCNKIKSLFISDLTIRQISKKLNCDCRTVRNTFIKEFGEKVSRKRISRIAQLSRNKIKSKSKGILVNKIKPLFTSDLTIKQIASNLKCSLNIIHDTFVKEFGKQAVRERDSRMKVLRCKRERKEIKNNLINNGDYSKIKSLFVSDLSIKQISHDFGYDDKVISRIFAEEFGEQAVRIRGRKIWAESIKGRNLRLKPEYKRPCLIPKLKKAFNGQEGMREMAEKFNISRPSIKRIWIEIFGKDAFKERCRKMMEVQRRHAARSLEIASFIGSKNERLCYRYLKEIFGNRNIQHHDYDIVPYLEIDISIPSQKIAITWDGPWHRKPISGEKELNLSLRNDARREKILAEKGWRHISVVDNGGHNPKFVRRIVDEFMDIVDMEWDGKKELR